MWNPHAYEKRVVVGSSGEVTTLYFSHAFVFSGSKNDCDITTLVYRPITKSAYAAARKRGGFRFETSVHVAKNISVERTEVS